MDVDAMDELMYDTLIRYFKTLAHTGYKSYDVVFKMLVMDFIYEITHTELRYYVTNKDIKLMQDLLYQFLGSTCEISFPANNRPCCICVCCNGEGTTPPPVVIPTTTTSTKPPVQHVYITLSSTVARSVYVNGSSVPIGTRLDAEVGSVLDISALDVAGYTFRGFYVNGSLISASRTLQYIVPSVGTTIELRYTRVSDSTTTTTLPPTRYYRVSMVSNVPCDVTGAFGGDSISGEVTSDTKTYSIERGSIPNGTITTCSAREVGYRLKGIYDVVSGSLLASSLPFNWTGSKDLRFEFEKDETSTTTTSTTSTTSSTSTEPPKPARTATITFKHDSRTGYTVTYNHSSKLVVSASEDEEVEFTLPEGIDSMQFMINSIVCTNPSYECSEIGQGKLPYSLSVVAHQNVVVIPVITEVESTTTTTTTTSSTSSEPPVVGNKVYYGVVKEYMSPFDFRGLPIDTLMEREDTKSVTITGTEVNEFTVPQDGYFNYLIVPVDKVELLYSAFTSGGIPSVYYDSTKENIPDETENGVYYSKYTRGGANANQGGVYNSVNYDVYFGYLANGGAPELVNIKAKNK